MLTESITYLKNIENFEKEQFVKCIICKTNNTELISKICRYNIPANNVICKECGHVYINPIPTAIGLKDYYKNDYRVQYTTTNLDSYQNLILKKAKAELLSKYIKRDGKVLEIGCANGVLLAEIKKIRPDLELFGIEPTVELAKKAKNKKIKIFEGIFEDYPLVEKKFDFIILDHVFEHFENPLSILKKIHYFLKDTGIVFIEVPNILRPYGDLDYNFFQHVHLHSFSEKTLEQIVNLSGFECLVKLANSALAFFIVKTLPSTEEKNNTNYSYLKILKFLENYREQYRILWGIFSERKDLFKADSIDISVAAQNNFLNFYTKVLSDNFFEINNNGLNNSFDVNSKKILRIIVEILKEKKVIK